MKHKTWSGLLCISSAGPACQRSVKTTTPIIFDHTHAHCKTLRAAEKRTTKRQAEKKDEKNEKNRNFVKFKKVFPRLSNTIIIDNATLTRINASGIFLKSMNFGVLFG
jgi:hypothetical protein